MDTVLQLIRLVILILVVVPGVELMAAIFSRRVRRYIGQHPIAHVVWFTCAVLLALIYLVPADSTPRRPEGSQQNTGLPNQRVERTGGSRLGQLQYERLRRLPPVAHADRWATR